MPDRPCDRCVFVPTPDGACICRHPQGSLWIPVMEKSHSFETMYGTADGPQASSPVALTTGGLRGQANHPAKD